MPIENEKNRCIACGAPLNIPVQGGRLKCDFCGAEAIYTPKSHNKETELVCPKCGAMLPRGAEHCSRCGLKLEFNCPKCEARNAYGAEFCVKCGVNIPAELDRLEKERQRLEEMQRRQAAAARAHMEAQQAARRRKNRIVGIILMIVLCFVLFIALILGGIINKGMYSPSARATQTAEKAAQAAAAEAILRLVDPASLMPDARHDIWEAVMSTDRVTTNLDVADSYPPGNQFGRITGHQRTYSDSDFCNPTWDIILQDLQVIIFQNSGGAQESFEYQSGKHIPTEIEVGDKGFIMFGGRDTSAICSIPFGTRWVELNFVYYNVIGVIYFETTAVDGADDNWLEDISTWTAEDIIQSIDLRIGR